MAATVSEPMNASARALTLFRASTAPAEIPRAPVSALWTVSAESACLVVLPAEAVIWAWLSAVTAMSRSAVTVDPVMKAVAPAGFSDLVAVAISGSPTMVSTAL